MMPAKQDHSFVSLKTLLRGIVETEIDCEIHSLQLNSQMVNPGSLFFACDGSQVHGIKFAPQAVKNGAAAILWEVDAAVDLHAKPEVTADIGIPVVRVKNLSQFIGLIAERFYAYPSRGLETIGVTGTNGKTSCSHFLAQCLTTDGNKCGLIGTLGYGVYGDLQISTHTTPDAITLHYLFDDIRLQGAKRLVMEVSSHGLSQGRVAGVEFDLAIFTNLSRDHLDYHADMDEYFKTKSRLFEGESLKYAVINVDDAFGRRLVDNHAGSSRLLCYGLEKGLEKGLDQGLGKGLGDIPGNCDSFVQGKELSYSAQGIRFKVDTSWGSANIRTSLLGEFNVSNLLAVLGALLLMDVPLPKAIEQIEKCKTIPGRMEKVDSDAELPTVVVDYAHTPDALEKALNALAVHKSKDSEKTSKLWCVFGCGGDRDMGKRAEMGRIVERFSDKVIITNDNPRTEDAQHIIADILKGIEDVDSILIEPDRVKAIANAVAMATADDIILLAGKGHESYQIVDGEKRAYLGDLGVVEAMFEQMRHDQ